MEHINKSRKNKFEIINLRNIVPFSNSLEKKGIKELYLHSRLDVLHTFSLILNNLQSRH